MHHSRDLKRHFVKWYLQVCVCNNMNKISQIKRAGHMTCTEKNFDKCNNTRPERIITKTNQPSDSTSQMMTTFSLSTEMRWSPKGNKRCTSASWPVYVWTTWMAIFFNSIKVFYAPNLVCVNKKKWTVEHENTHFLCCSFNKHRNVLPPCFLQKQKYVFHVQHRQASDRQQCMKYLLGGNYL